MIDDPRDLGGSISGPGGPYDDDQTIVDATRALIVSALTAARITEGAGEIPSFALLFEGHVNRTEDEAQVVLLGDLDMLATIITEAWGVAHRSGLRDELQKLCDGRWEVMP